MAALEDAVGRFGCRHDGLMLGAVQAGLSDVLESVGPRSLWQRQGNALSSDVLIPLLSMTSGSGAVMIAFGVVPSDATGIDDVSVSVDCVLL